MIVTHNQRARYTPALAGKPWKVPAVPLPSHQIEARVAKDTNQHIFSAQMSLAEIIEELPKLTPEERQTIYQQIERLDGEPNFEPTPEMLGAIEEGTRSAQTERMYTAEEIKDRVHRWANSRVYMFHADCTNSRQSNECH